MSTLFQSTASGKTATRQTGSDFRVKEDITPYINVYWDEILEAARGTIDSSEMMPFFNVRSQKNDTHIVQMKVAGNSVAQINDDGEPIPFISWGTGWNHVLRTYPWAIGVKHTKHLEEIDNYGEIAQEASEAGDAVQRTVRNIIADVLNRCVDDGSMTTGAPVLCPDGMYPIDSARPSPVVGAPVFSNLETIGAINEDLLFQAQLNAQFTQAENGDPMDNSISMVYIPSAYEKVSWKLDKTQKILGNGHNDSNWAAGRFEFKTLRDLTVNSILYTLGKPDDRNGFQLIWQIRPEKLPIAFEDPRLIGFLIRFRMGVAAMDMRKTLRGGLLSPL